MSSSKSIRLQAYMILFYDIHHYVLDLIDSYTKQKAKEINYLYVKIDLLFTITSIIYLEIINSRNRVIHFGKLYLFMH
ncbi:hypothetical protein NUSPORA_02775 [Nucleospora cyclopteri]